MRRRQVARQHRDRGGSEPSTTIKRDHPAQQSIPDVPDAVPPFTSFCVLIASPGIVSGATRRRDDPDGEAFESVNEALSGSLAATPLAPGVCDGGSVDQFERDHREADAAVLATPRKTRRVKDTIDLYDVGVSLPDGATDASTL